METRANQLLTSTAASNYLAIIKCDAVQGTRPFKCAIPTCTNTYLNQESHQKATYKFHNFPKGSLQSLRWRAICGLPLNTPITEELKICSDHFTVDDYSRDYKREFLTPGSKRALAPNALPTININYNLKDLEKVKEATTQVELTNTNLIKAGKAEDELINSDEEFDNIDLTTEVARLRQEVTSLENRITITQNSIVKKLKSIKGGRAHVAQYKKNIKQWSERIEARKTAPERFLSRAQIDLLKGEKKKVFWSDDDLAKAFTIRHMGGKELYLYMKNTLNYPLPSLSCVQAWAAN